MEEIKEVTLLEWIEALESGKYQQCRDELTKDNVKISQAESFCCLGVLCKLKGVDGTGITISYGNYAGELGVSSSQCIDWNDNDKLSFAEIAANLRKEYIPNG